MTREVKAPHGAKTVELTVRFWTDGIAEHDALVLQGFCWESGSVRFPVSETHGIKDQEWVQFERLNDIVPAIYEAARRAGVRILANTYEKPAERQRKK
jgi:hypothetical protein